MDFLSQKIINFAPSFEINVLLFIRLVVNRFKVKIMLLDFQTMALPISIAIASVLSLITLTDISSR